jgi:hypothetical protein
VPVGDGWGSVAVGVEVGGLDGVGVGLAVEQAPSAIDVAATIAATRRTPDA